MKGTIANLIEKYREIIAYGIVGVCTTVLNIVVFMILTRMVGISVIASNVLAWVAAFIFSFFANRKYVFPKKDEKNNTFKELFDFLWTRLATMLLDTFLIWLFVEVLFWDELVSKIAVNIIVIVLNFVSSKYLVFRKG